MIDKCAEEICSRTKIDKLDSLRVLAALGRFLNAKIEGVKDSDG